MPLAPPFTRENAAENARKATISRENNRKNRSLALHPSHATQRVAQQVEKILRWMDKEKDRDKFAQLTAMLDRLWDKAFPAVKGKSKRPAQAIPEPSVEPVQPQEQVKPDEPMAS